MSTSALIAGIGNIFLGDDGFGPEVIRRVRAHPLPPGITAIDYGIRGLHLSYDLLQPLELLIIVDALMRPGQPPGTLFALEPDLASLPGGDQSPHGMDLPAIFAQARALGAAMPPVRIVGCVPKSVEERMALSPEVDAVVDDAVTLVLELLDREIKPVGKQPELHP